MTKLLFGDRVRWELGPLEGGLRDLRPEELPGVERAVPKRVLEFAAGRKLARRLLSELGVTGPDGHAPALPRGADRAPVWPSGVVGTISHSERHCLVAVARAADWRSIGADVELPTALEQKLWELVLRPAERSWIEAQPEARRGVLAKLFFSAKESAYKCQAPLTGRMLEFTDVELAVAGDERAGTFAVRWFDAEVARSVPELEGRWCLDGDALVTAVALGH